MTRNGDGDWSLFNVVPTDFNFARCWVVLADAFPWVRHATTRFLLAQAQREFRSYENRVSFSYLSELPLEQLLATLSRLRRGQPRPQLYRFRLLGTYTQ